jgi:pimeloyl-[acyl-carrier protein] methyl ester esterase
LELLRQIDLRQELSKITMPTLVLHGSADVIIPIGAGRYLAATLPQAIFHEINGCGHAPFLSAVGPVCAAIRNFLP